MTSRIELLEAWLAFLFQFLLHVSPGSDFVILIDYRFKENALRSLLASEFSTSKAARIKGESALAAR